MTRTYFYDSEGRDRPVDPGELAGLARSLSERQLLWIDAVRADGVPDEASVALNVDPGALRAVLSEGPPPGLSTHGAQFSFGLPLPPSEGSAGARLDFVVGEGWLITVRDTEIPYLARFRDEDEGESFRGGLTPAALCASLVDRHLEAFQAAITAIHRRADGIDAEILGTRETRPRLAELAVMRRRVGALRDALAAHRGIIQGLVRPDFEPLAGSGDGDHFQALGRHFERAEDGIDRARETVLGSFELYATRTAQDTNEMVNTLTIVTVMLGIAGAIAGLFGMNFDLPFTHRGTAGFMLVTGGIVASSLLVLLVARWRRWL